VLGLGKYGEFDHVRSAMAKSIGLDTHMICLPSPSRWHGKAQGQTVGFGSTCHT